MDLKDAQTIVEYVALHSWRQSVLLYADPPWEMSDPHGLLDLVKKLSGASAEEIDDWAANAQERD